jgi:hypothetical protein
VVSLAVFACVTFAGWCTTRHGFAAFPLLAQKPSRALRPRSVLLWDEIQGEVLQRRGFWLLLLQGREPRGLTNREAKRWELEDGGKEPVALFCIELKTRLAYLAAAGGFDVFLKIAETSCPVWCRVRSVALRFRILLPSSALGYF